MIPKEWLSGKAYLKKEWWEPLVPPAIVVLVGISAFALGRLSVLSGQGSAQSLTTPGQE